MPGNLTPAQMFTHTLTELSGRSTLHALDITAAPAAGEAVNQGGVVTLNASGYFVAGLGSGVSNTATAHNTPMPIFVIQGTNEFDANSDVGNISGGVQSGIVASGGYEIETTEFVAGTYAPNDTLTFGLTSNRGKVTLSGDTYSDGHVVGVVSRGVRTNTDNMTVLAFWTVYEPAVHATTAGSFVPLTYLDTDGTLATNTDVKVATEKAVKTYIASAISAYIPLTYLDTDGTLTANSDVKIATQKAVKTYAQPKGA